MTDPNSQPLPPDHDKAVRQRILVRARAINGKLLARLATVSDDLDAGRHLAALDGLDGLVWQVETLRSFLLLLT